MSEFLVTTEAYGLRFDVPRGDIAVGASLRENGEFARPELDFLLDCADGDSGNMLDVGANLGAIALPFAAARRGWRVLAIEAHGALSEVLRGNAERNGLTNVTVTRAIAGNESKISEYPEPSFRHTGNFGDIGMHYGATAARTPAPMVRLDDVAPLDTQVIKVDVQGFEPQVLAGATRMLTETRPLWFIEAPEDTEVRREVVRILWDAGYAAHWFYSPFVTAKPERGAVENAFRGDANFVAVPEGRAIPWELQRVTSVDERRPGHISAYPYLKQRYGY